MQEPPPENVEIQEKHTINREECLLQVRPSGLPTTTAEISCPHQGPPLKPIKIYQKTQSSQKKPVKTYPIEYSRLKCLCLRS